MVKIPNIKPNEGADDIDALIRSVQDELQAIVDAIVADAENADLLLAALLDGKLEAVRLALLRHLREKVAERDDNKAKEIDALIAREQSRAQEQSRRSFRQWLMHRIAQDKRRLREALWLSPGVAKEVGDIGHELAAKGVIGREAQQQDLGRLSSETQQVKLPEKDTGRGRG